MKLYRQIILLTLTLLVLVSSTGIAVGLHICGGEIRDLTFFGAEADCPMVMHQLVDEAPACHAPQSGADDDVCCRDHQVIVERLDVAAKQSVLSLTKLQDIQLLAVIRAVVFQFYTPDTSLKPSYALYIPPSLARDIPVLVQAFLI